MKHIRSLKNDRADPVEGVEGFNEGRYQSKIERSERSVPLFQIGAAAHVLPIIDDSKLANEGGIFPEMLESSINSVLMPFQEGPTCEETRRRALVLFAKLEPVGPENLPSRDAVEVVADQREATNGTMRIFRGLGGPFDDV